MTTTQSTTHGATAIARLLDQAEREGNAIAQFGDMLSLEQAYEVQSELLALRLARGESLAGAKLGFTSGPRGSLQNLDHWSRGTTRNAHVVSSTARRNDTGTKFNVVCGTYCNLFTRT